MQRVRMKRNDYENVSKRFIGGPPATSSLRRFARCNVQPVQMQRFGEENGANGCIGELAPTLVAIRSRARYLLALEGMVTHATSRTRHRNLQLVAQARQHDGAGCKGQRARPIARSACA